ncbi:MAG: ribonuclease P protein component [Acidimicrobiia bacterium]
MIHRVRSRATFARLGRARPHRRGPLWVRCVAIDAGSPQVAYAGGRPVGNAVTRNRLRRRLRAAVAAREGLLADGRAYLVGATAAASDCTPTELDAWLASCLEAAR